MKPRTKMPNKKLPRRPPPKDRADNPKSLLYNPQFEKLVGEDCLITLKCSICLEFYHDPTVLPCGHTFCSKCLMIMAQHAKLNQRDREPDQQHIGCPECREDVFVSSLVNRETTLNYPIQQLIDIIMKREDGNGGMIITKPKMVNASTSYHTLDFQVDEKEADRSAREKLFDAVSKEFDGFERALTGGRSIVGDAFLEIEKIRLAHLQQQKRDSEAAAKARAEKKYIGKTQLDVTDFHMRPTGNTSMLDPAIVSYSMPIRPPLLMIPSYIRRPAVPVRL